MTPARNLLLLTAALVLLALAAVFIPGLGLFWTPAACVAVGAAMLDGYLSHRLPAVDLRRETRHSMPVGVWSPVILHLRNSGARDLRLRVHDHHPIVFAAKDMPRH